MSLSLPIVRELLQRVPSDLTEATRLIDIFEQRSAFADKDCETSPTPNDDGAQVDKEEEESAVFSPSESTICFVYACTK